VYLREISFTAHFYRFVCRLPIFIIKIVHVANLGGYSMYSIDCSVTGWRGLTNRQLISQELAPGDKVVVFVSGKCSSEKYRFIRRCLRSGLRVLLFVQRKAVDPLVYLSVNYGNYDIYAVDSPKEVTDKLVNACLARSPSLAEVGQYIGTDGVAYENLFEVLSECISAAKITSDVAADSLDGALIAYEYLKTVADLSLADDFAGASEQMAVRKAELENEKVRLSEDLTAANDRISTLESDLRVANSTPSVVDSGASANLLNDIGNSLVIQPTCNLDKLQSKVPHILYFKELSYVPFVNTLVNQLCAIINTQRNVGSKGLMKCKLLIEDFSPTQGYYSPLSVLSSEQYMARRDEFAGSAKVVVLGEPQLSVVSDLVTGKYSGADTPNVLVVYDRTHQVTDLVSGKSVSKYFVCHSSGLFNRVKDIYKITDVSRVITRPETNLGEGKLDIPRLAKFDNSDTDAHKRSTYAMLPTASGGKGTEPLVSIILKSVGINL
jgi:hypothetical protein